MQQLAGGGIYVAMPSPYKPIGLFGPVDGKLQKLDEMPDFMTDRTVEDNLRSYAKSYGVPLVFIGDSGSFATIAAQVLRADGYVFEHAGYSVSANESVWPLEEDRDDPEDRREMLIGAFSDELRQLDGADSDATLAQTVADAIPFEDDDDRQRVMLKLSEVFSQLRKHVLTIEDEFERRMTTRIAAEKLTEMLIGEPDDDVPEPPQDDDGGSEFRDPLEYGTYAEVHTVPLEDDDPLLELLDDADYDEGVLEFTAEFSDVGEMRLRLEALAGVLRRPAHFLAELVAPWVQYLVTATPGRILAQRIYLSFDLPEAQQAWAHFKADVPDEVVVETPARVQPSS